MRLLLSVPGYQANAAPPPPPLPTSDIMLQGLEDAFLCIMTVMSKSMGGE